MGLDQISSLIVLAVIVIFLFLIGRVLWRLGSRKRD